MSAQYSHRSSVAKSSVEWFSVWVEKVLDVCETLDLKLLGLLLNHLPKHNIMLNILFFFVLIVNLPQLTFFKGYI